MYFSLIIKCRIHSLVKIYFLNDPDISKVQCSIKMNKFLLCPRGQANNYYGIYLPSIINECNLAKILLLFALSEITKHFIRAYSCKSHVRYGFKLF